MANEKELWKMYSTISGRYEVAYLVYYDIFEEHYYKIQRFKLCRIDWKAAGTLYMASKKLILPHTDI